jgi:hypothetical protein
VWMLGELVMVGRCWGGDSKAHWRLVLVLGQAMLRGLYGQRGKLLLGRLERTLFLWKETDVD